MVTTVVLDGQVVATSWFSLPGARSLAIFLVGWGAGWLLFLRIRSLPSTELPRQCRASVIVPCRNEAANLGALLAKLEAALRVGDEIIVVDDESTDETAGIAAAAGACLVQVGAPPAGWAGKPHACWRGAQQAGGDVLVFLDADVRPTPSGLHDLIALSEANPDAVVSAMPWHRTVGAVERFSMLFNTVSSLVASIAGGNSRHRVAYGPFLAVHRTMYEQVGGHAHPAVRGAVVEDLALARVMPRAVATVARRTQVEYRMYPHGARQLWEGWSKNTAIGASSVPRSSAIASIAWVFSLCGGPFTSAWCYLLSLAQVLVMARRVGNFGAWSAVLYPLHAAFFVLVALRSAVRSVLFGRVAWRGRVIATR